MYALCYGTLPLVRNTGGLADTVVENGDASTGFVFENAEVKDLSLALVRACALYRSTSHWKKRQVNAMQQDFGWSISAKKYLAAYGQIPQA
jgi:starch synthase